jgi:hypothetical protein
MTGRTRKKTLKSTKKKPLLLWGIAGLVVVLAAGFFVFRKGPAAYTPSASGGPRLQTEQTQEDLGNIKLGTTVQVSFNVKNVGDQPLIFTQAPYVEVKVGCCPPTPTLGKKVLQPGESTTVSFPLMMHATMGGKHDLRVHIPNNDPQNKNFEFVLLSNWVD